MSCNRFSASIAQFNSFAFAAGAAISVLAKLSFQARPSPKQRGLPRHDQVLTIDLVSPTMAYVKLKCAIPPSFFTDQLSLLKIDGRWQIAQKVFMTEMRE